MVQLKIREMAEKRGITQIMDFAARAELAYDTASDLWHGRMQRVDRKVLGRVCKALVCTPGDLLVLEEDEASNNSLPLQVAA